MSLKPDPMQPGDKSVNGSTSTSASEATPSIESIEFDFINGAVVRRAPGATRPPIKVQSTVEPSVPISQRSAAAPAPSARSTPLRSASISTAAPLSTPTPTTAKADSIPKPTHSSQPMPIHSSPTEKKATTPPPNLDDFRRNADRQSREQKTFGNVLATITYCILIAFILVTGMAAYGGYILFERIKLQETSLAEIDKHYEAELMGMKEDLNRTHADAQRLSDEVNRQQDQIAHLKAASDKTTADLASSRHDLTTLQAQVDRIRGVR